MEEYMRQDDNQENGIPGWLDKDPSRARIVGGVFEFQVAGLAALRIRALRRCHPELNLRFSLATNVDGANPFDDIVLYLQWTHEGRHRAMTYFVQLKHKENIEVPVSGHDLTATVSKRNKDFNLHHYYERFIGAVEEIEQTPEGQLTPTQEFLRDRFREDFRLVLLTTRQVYPKETRAASPLEFPFEKLFYTGQGEMFSFGEFDHDVWNMMGGECSGSFQKEFLPRLRIFSAQSQVSALQPLLFEALEDALGGHLARKERLLASFSSSLQKWWESDCGNCLSDETCVLEENIRADMHEGLQKLDFHTRHYEELSRRLENCDAAYIVVPGVQDALRSAIIREVLEKSKPGRYLIITGRILNEYSEFAIESLISKLCDELVINVKVFNKKTRNFVEKLISKRHFAVRILTSNWDMSIYRLLESRKTSCTAWTERWMLSHLTAKEQSKLLTKRINFQGQETTLGALQESWPSLRRNIHGATLDALVTGKKVNLGDQLAPLDPLYIERSLEHKGHPEKVLSFFYPEEIMVDRRGIGTQFSYQDLQVENCNRQKLWNLRKPRSRFVVTDFPEDLLEKMRSPKSSWEECNSSWTPLDKRRRRSWPMAEMEVKTKWCVWRNVNPPAKQNFRNGATLWCLTFEGGKIVCDFLDGEKNFLKAKMRKRRQCTAADVCVHEDMSQFVECDGVLLLASDPGIGKTTFLQRMSHMLKEKFPSQWVLLVRISHGTLMEDTSENPQVKDVVNILTRVAHSKETNHCATKHFIEDCLKRSGNISILLDGVDEVCPSHKEKALRILHILLRETRFERLWVAARPVLEEDLSGTLCCPPFRLRPFSPEQQRQYLFRHWMEDLTGVTSSQLQERADRLLQVVRTATERDGRTLCDVPLYLRMLAEAYREEYALSENAPRPGSFVNISRLRIMRKFLDETRKVYWTKTDLPMDKIKNAGWDISSEDTFVRHHKSCASYLLFTEDILGCFHDALKKEVEEITSVLEKEKTGIIIKVIAGKPVFIHRIFAEYFAALWLSENYGMLSRSVEFLYNGDLEEVRYFFDALLSEGHALHEAVISNQVESLREVLHEARNNVQQGDKGGRHALHLAAISGCEEAVKALLNAGADMKTQDKVLGWTPFRYTCKMVRVPEEEGGSSLLKLTLPHLAVADIFLHSGMKLTDDPDFSKRKEVLNLAIRYDFSFIAREFLKKEKTFFWMKWRGDHLHVAAKYNSVKVMALLIGLGFKVNEEDADGVTPLHKSAKFGQLEASEVLIQNGAIVNKKDIRGDTPLHKASALGKQIPWKRHSLWKVDDRKHHRFKCDTNAKYNSICRLLLDSGAEVNTTNNLEFTPLHLAVLTGREILCQILLMRGANPNATARKGITPLSWARRSNRDDLCCLLQHYGGKSQLKMDETYWMGGSGLPELHLAVRGLDFMLCRKLLNAGASVNAVDRSGETVLHCATRSTSRVMRLFLLENGADVNARDYDGQTVLHFAAWYGRESWSQILLHKGADVNAHDANRDTPLHLAAGNGHYLVVQLLLDRGARIEEANLQGNTALHKAVRQSSLAMVKLLLDRGANVEAKNVAGETPSHVAARARSRGVTQLLESGADA